MTTATLTKTGKLAFTLDECFYTTEGDWQSDFAEYGYTMVHGMKARTDSVSPGTRTRQHSQLILHNNGDVEMVGYIIGHVEIPAAA